MKPVSIYELTFELYFDDKQGYFYNFLVRYYDKNSKIHTGSKTVEEYRLYSYEVAKMLKITKEPKDKFHAALVRFPAEKLVYLEKLFWNAKHCIVHDSQHLTGRIYDQYFDNLKDMRTDFWRKLVDMKTAIQTDQETIRTIQDIK